MSEAAHVEGRAARVLLVVGGGIAAYKTPELVREIIRRGPEVQVITTPSASAFVTELSLGVVSKRPVRSSLLDASQEGQVGHIELADWPDLVVVAPATANLMARAAHGLADDLATTVLLATRAPILWAPAMNVNMWRHPATKRALARLAEDGGAFVGPDRGDLACGWVGEGRMIDPPIIADEVVRRLALARSSRQIDDSPNGPANMASRKDADTPTSALQASSVWRGRRVLVSAGPTRAYLDPVRFVSNASTGAMGFAIAAEAARAGADVVLVSGPVGLATPPGVRRFDIETAAQLLAVMDAALTDGSFDLVAMAAAVSDLAPPPSPGKLEKDALLEHLGSLTWSKEVDVLATLAARHGGTSHFMGFAAQTLEDADPGTIEARLVALATEKLRRKGVPCVFVNRVGVPDTGFQSPTNAGWLVVAREDAVVSFGSGAPRPKAALAAWLLDTYAREVLRDQGTSNSATGATVGQP